MRRGAFIFLLCACSSESSPGGGGHGGSAGSGGAGGSGGSTVTAVALPQALDGAMQANPTVYSMLPVRVAVTGHANSVRVRIDPGADWTDAHDGVAQMNITNMDDGIHHLIADADGMQATADLAISHTGIQLTSFAQVGTALSPRLHRQGDHAYITWTDRSQSLAEAYLRRIDGAGRWQGDAIALVHASEDTLYARTAFGAHAIGVLYQGHGGPYTNYFKRVDFQGNAMGDPIALDPANRYGSFGGDIFYDGAAFQMIWRSNDGMGGSEIRWLRVDESTGGQTGPVVVAASGPATAANPDGAFQPISFIQAAQLGEVALVSFVRGRYSAPLDQAVPKSQIVRVHKDGTVDPVVFAGNADDFTWHDEARVYRVGDVVVPLWSAQDLNNPADNPPKLFFSANIDTLSSDDIVLDAPGDRYEPFVLAHPEQYAVMAWLDGRSYEVSMTTGRIQLMVAALSATRTMGTPVVFDHARFVADTSDLNGALAGPNVMLIWLDERHGMGIADPKPEIYFETAWF